LHGEQLTLGERLWPAQIERDVLGGTAREIPFAAESVGNEIAQRLPDRDVARHRHPSTLVVVRYLHRHELDAVEPDRQSGPGGEDAARLADEYLLERVALRGIGADGRARI
jgi:hypothetical protein